MFDRLVADSHISFIDLEIDETLKAGGSWQEIVGTLGAWLRTQSSPVALNLAARALCHAGTRGDLTILTGWNGSDQPLSEAEFVDTRFAVHRRVA